MRPCGAGRWLQNRLRFGVASFLGGDVTEVLELYSAVHVELACGLGVMNPC